MADDFEEDEDDKEWEFERRVIIWTPDNTETINQLLAEKWDLMICAPSTQSESAFCLLERKLPD